MGAPIIDRIAEVLKTRTLASDQEDELVRIVEKATQLYHPDGEEHGKPTEAYRLDQIAGHERIAQRRRALVPNKPESWYYRGPDATKEERVAALEAVSAVAEAAVALDVKEAR